MKKSVVVNEECHSKIKEISDKTGIKIYKLMDDAADYLYKKHIINVKKEEA